MAFHLPELIALLLLAAAAATTSTTLTKGSIFRAVRLKVKPAQKDRRFRMFIWKLISCPYCMSHWVSAVVLLVYPVAPLQYLGWPDYVLSWLILVFVSAILSGILIRLISFSEDDDEPLFTLTEALAHFQQVAKESPP